MPDNLINISTKTSNNSFVRHKAAKSICYFLMLSLGYTMPCIAISLSSNDWALLPEPIANNAVAQVIVQDKQYLLSFSGLGKNKTYRDVHNKAFLFDVSMNTWKPIAPVPIEKPINGLTGRLASVATGIHDKAYVFGGYTVAKDHSEVSVPDVYSYEVTNDTYTKLMSMPVPVDDSVALPYANRYIYLVSGWHNDGNVNLVQLYDTKTDTWQQASPFPGKAVFGHAGGIVGNTFVICDGVRVDVHINKRRSYAAEANCYLGEIDTLRPSKISWQLLRHPTGKSKYRMAATGIHKSQKIVFIGGSVNPYNFSGIGYNAQPSSPDNGVWIYDVNKQKWQVKTAPTATMDHRGLLVIEDELLTIGGMGENQKVLNTINKHGKLSEYL